MKQYEFNSDSCYVAFFDILGYSQLVIQNNHDLLKKIHQFSIPTSIASTLPQQRIIVVNEKNFIIGNNNDINVQTVTIADSVVIWSPDDSINSFYDIIFKSMDVIVEGLLRYLPVRGVITLGPLSCFSTFSDNKPAQVSLFGRPIVEAYNQHNFDLIGCIVDQKAIDTFRKKSIEEKVPLDISGLFNNKILVDYEIPYKSGKIVSVPSVNWTLNSTWHNEKTIKKQRKSIRQFITEVFSHFDKESNTWEVRNKLINTIEYIKNVSNVDIDYSNLPSTQGIIDSPKNK
jgi:hypothetical protein